MQLLSVMLADMSEATDVLVRKLNCETKCELCVNCLLRPVYTYNVT